MPAQLKPRRSFARISGMERTLAAMRSLPAEVSGLMAGFIREAAAFTERDARRRAPARTGDLARSITSVIREDGLQATVGSNLYYAPFVELGHSTVQTVGTRKGKRSWKNKVVQDQQTTGHVPPRPFLQPAFRAGLRHFRKSVKGLDAGLKKRFKTSRFKPKAGV